MCPANVRSVFEIIIFFYKKIVHFLGRVRHVSRTCSCPRSRTLTRHLKLSVCASQSSPIDQSKPLEFVLIVSTFVLGSYIISSQVIPTDSHQGWQSLTCDMQQRNHGIFLGGVFMFFLFQLQVGSAGRGRDEFIFTYLMWFHDQKPYVHLILPYKEPVLLD